MKRSYAVVRASDERNDLCVVCKRYAFAWCAACEARNQDHCWVTFDPANGLRHCHCTYELRSIKRKK